MWYVYLLQPISNVHCIYVFVRVCVSMSCTNVYMLGCGTCDVESHVYGLVVVLYTVRVRCVRTGHDS